LNTICLIFILNFDAIFFIQHLLPQIISPLVFSRIWQWKTLDVFTELTKCMLIRYFKWRCGVNLICV